MQKTRDYTRKQRYLKRLPTANFLPVELCTVNFKFDQNLGFLIRAAACFGVRKINIIGSIPDRNKLKSYSGSLCDYVVLESFSNPSEYLEYVKKTGQKIISAEISNSAKSISGIDFSNFSNFHLVVGNESTGVPEEILRKSVPVYVPLPGIGYCLNTSQAANIFLYEISKQNINNKTKNSLQM
jgi:tRNA G18 (ribose-2'-O)-methylase SpoU|tara:strand:- start:3951 stop:4499 length:549 start_codon:yes stop_codon:yes gene_type:complete